MSILKSLIVFFPITRRFCCQNDAHKNLKYITLLRFPLRNCKRSFPIIPVTCHSTVNCPSCLRLMNRTLMVFVLVCLLDSFPGANGIKEMATSLACQVMVRQFHGPLALWWMEKEWRQYLVWWFPLACFLPCIFHLPHILWTGTIMQFCGIT